VIARTWSGSTPAANADAYVQHLRDHTLPQLRELAGHLGAYVLRRRNGAVVDFTVVTLWESIEAIARFAGDDLEQAVVPPEAEQLLAAYDRRAVHWDVVEAR